METLDREYKESFGDSALRAICAMANSRGGTVIIGVADNGEIKGVNIKTRQLEKITQKIVNKLGLHPQIKVNEKNGKQVLVINVQKSNVPISFNGRYYERVGNTTREMGPDRLKEFFLKGVNWDALINSEASFDDIDVATVERFLQLATDQGRLTAFDKEMDIRALFEHLRLSVDGKLTNGAIILFGKDPQKFFINAVLRIVRFRDGATIIGDRTIAENLFKQVFDGEEAIKQFINVRYRIKELVRKEIWDYPLDAIREAVINALIHRDYFKYNVQTQIKIYDDSMWFYNPGGLPEGITIEQLKRPHPSVPRNPLLVHIFYLAGLIEEVGSGIERIYKSFRAVGLPEPEFREEMGGFSVYFRKDVYTEEYLKELGLSERQIKAVMYVKEKGGITNREYREMFDISDRTALNDLKDLCRKGIVVRVGRTGRSTKYVLIKPGSKPEKPEINQK